MDDGRPELGPCVERDLVEEASAERAAEDEHDLGVGRETERGTRLGARARQRTRRDRPADRPVLLPVAADGQREEDAVGERRGEPVREPEVRVGLGERARDPAQPRRRAPSARRRNRPRRARRRDDASAGSEGTRPAPSSAWPTARTSATPGRRGKPEIGNESNCVAALGDERRLDAVRRPGERHEHAAALAALPRLRVPARRVPPSPRPRSGIAAVARPPLRAMLRSTPTAPSITMRLEPP